MSFGDYRDHHTRAQHLAWAKKRALAELEEPGVSAAVGAANAFASMVSDLNKHPETRDHVANKLGFALLLGVHLSMRDAMRRHIEGYN